MRNHALTPCSITICEFFIEDFEICVINDFLSSLDPTLEKYCDSSEFETPNACPFKMERELLNESK